MIKPLLIFIPIIFFSCTNKKTTENPIIIHEKQIIENFENKQIITGDYYTDDNIIIDNEQINSKLPFPQLVAKMLADNEISVSNGESILSIKGSIHYNNRDALMVYENYSKESDYILVENQYVFLIRIDESPGWYYLISSDYEAEGYIFLYDISEKSFYGNPEENNNSGNYYRNLLNTEYEIIKQNENIKRYGPLLTISQKGKTTEFLDTSYGSVEGEKYLLLDYYSEYNELLILKQYWEGAYMFIFNLDDNKYSCENIGNPCYNNTRTYMLSLVYIENIGFQTIFSLKLYKIANGIYEEIYNKGINIFNSWHLQKIDWINNNEINIDYGEFGKIIISINDDAVNVINNLPTEP